MANGRNRSKEENTGRATLLLRQCSITRFWRPRLPKMMPALFGEPLRVPAPGKASVSERWAYSVIGTDRRTVPVFAFLTHNWRIRVQTRWNFWSDRVGLDRTQAEYGHVLPSGHCHGHGIGIPVLMGTTAGRAARTPPVTQGMQKMR